MGPLHIVVLASVWHLSFGGQVLYYSNSKVLGAYSTTDGRQIWNASCEDKSGASYLSIASNGKVLFKSGMEWIDKGPDAPHPTVTAKLQAVDAGSGITLWKLERVDHFSPYFLSGLVFIPAIVSQDSKTVFWASQSSNLVQALSVSNGKSQWNFSLTKCNVSHYSITLRRILLSADGETLAVLCDDKTNFSNPQVHVQAVRTSDGKASWSADWPGYASSIAFDPKIGASGGMIFAEFDSNSGASTVTAVSMATGSKVWSRGPISVKSSRRVPYGGRRGLMPLAVSDNGQTLLCTLWTSMAAPTLMALDLEGKGSVKWYSNASLHAYDGTGPNPALAEAGLSPISGDAILIGIQGANDNFVDRVSLTDGSAKSFFLEKDCGSDGGGNCGADGNLVLSEDGTIGFGSFRDSKFQPGGGYSRRGRNIVFAFNTATGEVQWQVQLPVSTHSEHSYGIGQTLVVGPAEVLPAVVVV